MSFNYKHGLRYHFIYTLWCNIKNRCYNKKTPKYHMWGGRGIKMQDSWVNDVTEFYNYVTSIPCYDESNTKGLSLDRIDNDGNYCEGNLRWATPLEQSYNQRDKPSRLTANIRKRKSGNFSVRVESNYNVFNIGTFSSFIKAVRAKKEFLDTRNIRYLLK